MISRGSRMRKAVRAMGFGWGCALLATLPLQLAEILRNSGTDLRLFASALGLGFSIWAVATFGGVLIALVLVGLPVAAIVPAEWIAASRGWFTGLSAAAGAMLAIYVFRIWHVFDHMPADMTNFDLYLVFSTAFATASAWRYARLLARLAPAGAGSYAHER